MAPDPAEELALDLQLALGRLHPTRPHSVPRASRLGRPLVPSPPQEARHLLLQGTLQDQTGSQPADLGQMLCVAQPLAQQLLDGRLQDGARRYP